MQDGPAYVRVFVSILRNISKEETIEYVLALIDEMLTGRKAFGNQISGQALKLTFDTNYLGFGSKSKAGQTISRQISFK